MAIGPASIVIRDDAPLAATVDGEVVMLSLRAGAYFGLGVTGSEIWTLLERPRRVDAIVADLLDRYDCEAETCLRDTLAFLEDLLRRGLIRVAAAPGPAP